MRWATVGREEATEQPGQVVNQQVLIGYGKYEQ